MANIITSKDVPDAFQQSYEGAQTYPLNLLPRSLTDRHDPYLLSLYQSRLQDRKTTLFDSQISKVPVRDISIDGTVEKAYLTSDDDTKSHLGFKRIADPNNPGTFTGDCLVSADPRCRFIFLPSQSQKSPLQVSESMLLRLLSYYQVMPSFLDFLFVFGTDYGKDREIRYSGFRTDITNDPHHGHKIQVLGRSGYRVQVCYNLKTVANLTRVGTEWQWSLRQAAIHHQFDLREGNQLWIVGDPHRNLAQRIGVTWHQQQNQKEHFDSIPQALRSSLDTHLVLIHWATRGWRQLIQVLEEILQDMTLPLLSRRDPRQTPRLTPFDLAELQDRESKVTEALIVLESNEDNLKSLREFYQAVKKTLTDNDHFTGQDKKVCIQVADQFASQLSEMLHETALEIKHAKLLGQAFADRKTILLQHLEAQASAKAEDINASMWNLAKKSENEAIAMRIITVIALVYLPPTFVTSFFSAGIIKPEDTVTSDGSQTGLSQTVADYSSAPFAGIVTAWQMLRLWATVTFPITAVTIGLAGVWLFIERGRIDRQNRIIQNQWPDLFANQGPNRDP